MAVTVSDQLAAAGFEVRMVAADAAACNRPPAVTIVDHEHAAVGAEIVLAFGGDGTFLRAAEFARPAGVPMLGVNFGHVGFLAEAEPDELAATVTAIVDNRYEVEERVSIDAEVWLDDELLATAWALNEASLERSNRERILEVAVAVDGRPLLRFGCDGVLCVDIDLLRAGHAGVLSCDGRRSVDVPPGGRVRVRRGALPVRIVRMDHWSFADRLVTKFQLPVRGFRDDQLDYLG
jgi:NAD+ kinase